MFKGIDGCQLIEWHIQSTIYTVIFLWTVQTLPHKLEELSISLNLSAGEFTFDLKLNKELTPPNFSYTIVGDDSSAFQYATEEVNISPVILKQA